MGITERKTREKEELRSRIIEAAYEMFVKEGYEAVSLRKIAEVIEYSPATIYLHFKNKDELMYFVQQEGFDRFFEYLRPVQEIDDPRLQFREMGRLYLRFAIENPEVYDLMFILRSPMNAAEITESGWECGFEAFFLLHRIVENCQKAGYFTERDPYEVSLANWSFAHGLATLYLRNRLPMIPEELALPMINDAMEIHFQHLFSE